LNGSKNITSPPNSLISPFYNNSLKNIKHLIKLHTFAFSIRTPIRMLPSKHVVLMKHIVDIPNSIHILELEGLDIRENLLVLLPKNIKIIYFVDCVYYFTDMLAIGKLELHGLGNLKKCVIRSNDPALLTLIPDERTFDVLYKMKLSYELWRVVGTFGHSRVPFDYNVSFYLTCESDLFTPKLNLGGTLEPLLKPREQPIVIENSQLRYT